MKIPNAFTDPNARNILINVAIAFALYKVFQAIGFIETKEQKKTKKFLKEPYMEQGYFKEKLSDYTPLQGAAMLRSYRTVSGTPSNYTFNNVVTSGYVGWLLGGGSGALISSWLFGKDEGQKEGQVDNFYKWAANRIYGAKGVVADKESKVIEVFSQMRSKVEISYLCYVFNQIYKQTLSEYLSTFIEWKDGAKLYDMTRKLPEFKKPPLSEVKEEYQQKIFSK